MRLILVRHGHTDDLKNDIVQGHRPIPLNRRGRQQAKLVATALRRLKIHRMYSSDSVRTRQTAEYIAIHQPRLVVSYLPLLREKGGGIFEGRTHAYAKKVLKEKYFDPYHRPQRGESWHDVFQRTIRALRYFKKYHPRSTILIVSHGGWMRLLLTHIFHGSKIQWHPEYHHHNTGISIVEWQRGQPKLVRLNDTKHLGRMKIKH